jgi:TRAP-type mannitol/chloroaromatic compound transport system permease large subunit
LRRPGTPGINTFIVASMEEGITLPQVFRGVLPFLLCFLACAALLLAWPQLAL